MRKLTWSEYLKILEQNTVHHQEFTSSGDLFTAEYQGVFRESGLGFIEVKSVQGIGNYSIKKTKAFLEQVIDLEMRINEPIFTIGMLMSGSFSFHASKPEQSVRLEAPSVVIYRQTETFSHQIIDADQPYETLNLTFIDKVLQRLLHKFPDSQSILNKLGEGEMVVLSPESQYLGALFSKLDLIPFDRDIHNLFHAESLVLKILNKALMLLGENDLEPQLDRNEKQHAQTGASRFYEIMAFIKSNYQKAITVELISDQFGAKERWFQRRFRDELGTSFSEYLRDVRLSKAYDLLSDPTNQLSIREVCLKVGYTSSQTFSTNFKRRFGIKPKDLATR
jgi:AraC-like DNA-binding protein